METSHNTMKLACHNGNAQWKQATTQQSQHNTTETSRNTMETSRNTTKLAQHNDNKILKSF